MVASVWDYYGKQYSGGNTDSQGNSTTSTNTSTPMTSMANTVDSGTEIPQYRTDAHKGIVAKSAEIASYGHQPYNQPRLAPFDEYQNRAYTGVGQNEGAWRPDVASASRHAESGMAPFSQAGLQPFLSPYMSGVVDEMGRLGMEQFRDTIFPGVMDPFTGGGQFGSTRSMNFARKSATDFAADLAGRQGAALQQGYDSAMKNYNDWSQRQVSGAQQLGALGQMRSQLGYTDTAAMDAMGAQRQGQSQRAHDIAYENFLADQRYPFDTLTWQNSILQGTPYSTSAYRTEYSPSQPPATPYAQAISGLTGALGGYNVGADILKKLGMT